MDLNQTVHLWMEFSESISTVVFNIKETNY